MKEKKQIGYLIACIVLLVVANMYLFKHFNLSWVETTEDGAKVTINFLIPMNQEVFNKHLSVSSTIDKCDQFNYSLKWLNSHMVEINLEEENEIKGQKIKLLIKNAPTSLANLTKSDTISIQFKTNVEIVAPSSELLISSTMPFIVQFNTPMNSTKISRYVQCNTKFYIKPYEITLPSGEKCIDQTQFVFIPKKKLENEKKYVLLFKAGMPSQGGSFLKEDQAVILQVDSKPTILKTYPTTGDKWIGLYPCFTLKSKEPIIYATATINKNQLEGTLIDSYHAYFLLDQLLEPETSYKVEFQTQVASGELSNIKTIEFTTTTVNNKRFWIEISCGSQQVIKCYEGNTCIKTIPYEIGSKKNLPRYGTYYSIDKNEVYEDNIQHLGANYWIKVNEDFGIHGQVRNSYWQLSNTMSPIKNITIADADAGWLYHKMSEQTMIVVRK